MIIQEEKKENHHCFFLQNLLGAQNNILQQLSTNCVLPLLFRFFIRTIK